MPIPNVTKQSHSKIPLWLPSTGNTPRPWMLLEAPSQRQKRPPSVIGCLLDTLSSYNAFCSRPRHSDPATDAASKHEELFTLPSWGWVICFIKLPFDGKLGISPEHPFIKKCFHLTRQMMRVLGREDGESSSPHLPRNIRGGTVSVVWRRQLSYIYHFYTCLVLLVFDSEPATDATFINSLSFAFVANRRLPQWRCDYNSFMPTRDVWQEKR